MAVAKANKILGMLKNTFKYWDVENTKLLYCSLVRPHLEFASSVWSPQLKGNIDKLEKVQKRATRLPIETRHLTYEERLKVFNLQSLESRRKRGDLIQYYKIINGLDVINWHVEIPNKINHERLRGHNFKIERELTKFGPRFNFFRNRISTEWNKLEKNIVTAKNLNQFKAKLDEMLNK